MEMSAAWSRYDLAAASPPEARQIAEKVRAPWTRGGPEIASITEKTIAGVRVRIYDPNPAADKPALIYLHGGGWMLFSLDTHDRVMREYAARAQMTVVGVDYALAPEAKYPVALDQVVAVAEELHALGMRLCIGGDSAGANLALATALRLRNDNIIQAMVLNYGVFDRVSTPDARTRLGGPGNMLTFDEMENFWKNYLRADSDEEDPYVTPLRADLHGLPRTLLVVPQYDLLTEQSVALAYRMRDAGVPVELKMYRGAVHSFLEAVSISSLAQQAFDDTAKWLREE